MGSPPPHLPLTGPASDVHLSRERLPEKAVYELHVEDHFSAAHSLRGYKGKCEALHGHNWKVEVSVRSPSLDKLGMVIDFTDIKTSLKCVLDRLDHKHLNADVAEFGEDGDNPTTENIARLIAGSIASSLPAGASVSRVRVWESEKCSAEWRPDGA